MAFDYPNSPAEGQVFSPSGGPSYQYINGQWIVGGLPGSDLTVMSLTDGVAAPATIASQAQIYVDIADGDLKVKFGDGTIKTITVDT